MPKKVNKKKKKEASLRLKKAFKFYLENGGNLSRAMKDAGYSDAVAKNPHKLRESKSWQVLLQEHLPDEDLAEAHKKLLNKQEVIAKNNNKTGKIDVVKTGEIDVQAVGKGLDMAYKLKGKYAAQTIKFEDELETISDEDIENELKKRKLRESSKKPTDKKED